MLLDLAGFLQVLGLDKCRQAVTVKETSLVPVLAHDMITGSPGLEFLIATDDGALLCLRQTNTTGLLPLVDITHVNLFAWPTEVKNANNFAFAQVNEATHTHTHTHTNTHMHKCIHVLFYCDGITFRMSNILMK